MIETLSLNLAISTGNNTTQMTLHSPSCYTVGMTRRHFRQEIFQGANGEICLGTSGHMAGLYVKQFQPDDTRVRDMLAALRDHLGFSTPSLAALLGISNAALRHWMSGTRRPCGAARRLIWLLHANLLAPESLTKPGAWMVWGAECQLPIPPR